MTDGLAGVAGGSGSAVPLPRIRGRRVVSTTPRRNLRLAIHAALMSRHASGNDHNGTYVPPICATGTMSTTPTTSSDRPAGQPRAVCMSPRSRAPVQEATPHTQATPLAGPRCHPPVRVCGTAHPQPHVAAATASAHAPSGAPASPRPPTSHGGHRVSAVTPVS
jgi:hypothetical protein